MSAQPRRRGGGYRIRAEDLVPIAFSDPWPTGHPTHDELVALWLEIAHALGYLVTVTHDSRREHWGADSGWPDVFAVKNAHAFAIEIKTPSYPSVTEEQHAWLGALGGVPGITEGIFRTSGDRARDMAVIADVLRLAVPTLPRGG